MPNEVGLDWPAVGCVCRDALFKEAATIAELSAKLIPAAVKRSAWQIATWVLTPVHKR